jgi:hypothetical protein
MSIPNNVIAESFIESMQEGTSEPVLLSCSDGNGYVVRPLPRDNDYSFCIREYIATRIIKELGFISPEPAIIQITQPFREMVANEEPRFLRSGEYLFGSRYMEELNPPLIGNHLYSLKLACEVIFIDSFLYNIDRTAYTPNFGLKKNSIVLFDNECSFYFLYTIFPDSSRILPKAFEGDLQNHYFYSRVKGKSLVFDSVIAQIQSLNLLELRNEIRQLPDIWNDDNIAEKILNYLDHAQNNIDHFTIELSNFLI